MRNLWRTTTYLFWQFPILWLPLILAKFAGFGLRSAERALFHQWAIRFLLWLTETHSVLSGATIQGTLTPQIMAKAEILAAPLALGTQFISTFLLASSMVVTAALLSDIAETGRSGSLQTAMPPVAASIRRILVYSLKLFALDVLSGTLASLLMPWATGLQSNIEIWMRLSIEFRISLERMNLPIYLCNLLFALGIAYIIAPIAIRLLQPQGSTPTPQQAKTARIAWILTAVFGTILGVAVSGIEASFFQQLHTTSDLAALSISAIASVINALPNIPLFIALYLIATPNSPLTNPPIEQLQQDA